MGSGTIGYGGRSELHPGSTAGVHNTPGTVVAILWVLSIASMLIFGQPAAAADNKNYPNLSNRTMSSKELEEILKNSLGATLHNVTINGTLHLPERLEQLQAFNVTLPDGLDASTDNPAKVQRGSIKFHDSTFGGPVDLYLADIRSLMFEDCEFEEVAKFHSLKADKFLIISTTFRSRATFGNMNIKSLDLYEVDFQGYTNFVGSTFGPHIHIWRVDSSKPIIIEWSQVSNGWLHTEESWVNLAPSRAERQSRARQVETELRLLKKNFEDLGQKRDALEVNRSLIQFHRSHFLSHKDVEWWLTYILQWPTSYGTSPFRPVWIAVLVIVVFAALFFHYNVFSNSSGLNPAETAPAHQRMSYSIVYSVNAFVPLLNLVDEDKWAWKLSSRYRWLELIEKACGLLITLLAAYSVSSYVL